MINETHNIWGHKGFDLLQKTAKQYGVKLMGTIEQYEGCKVWEDSYGEMELVAVVAKCAIAPSGGKFDAGFPATSVVLEAGNLCCIDNVNGLVGIDLNE
mgnify:CR=1 FL=1